MTDNAKKMPMNELKAQIEQMVKEEILTFLQEQGQLPVPNANDNVESEYFSKIKDKPAFIAWVMKHYFSPSRKDMPWYSSSVTPENVLTYVSNPRNKFPLTPRELKDDWYLKSSLKGRMSQLHDKDVQDFEKNAPPARAAGGKEEEMNLRDIGDEIGLSSQQINNIEQASMQKVFQFLGGKNPLDMDEEELDDLMYEVDDIRETLSHEFAKIISQVGAKVTGDVNQYLEVLLKSLVKARLIANKDRKILGPKEIEMLVFLKNKPENEIAEYLRGDAKKSENRMKLFQVSVARHLADHIGSGSSDGEDEGSEPSTPPSSV